MIYIIRFCNWRMKIDFCESVIWLPSQYKVTKIHNSRIEKKKTWLQLAFSGAGTWCLFFRGFGFLMLGFEAHVRLAWKEFEFRPVNTGRHPRTIQRAALSLNDLPAAQVANDRLTGHHFRTSLKHLYITSVDWKSDESFGQRQKRKDQRGQLGGGARESEGAGRKTTYRLRFCLIPALMSESVKL